MANEHDLKYVALGITTHCSHNCRFCYETANLGLKDRCHGDIMTLKQIAEQLHKADVEHVELVGGDPSEHPDLVQLVKYMNELGLKIGILSNTHKQWREVAPYVSALEWTVHGLPAYHDAHTWRGTHRQVLERLRDYADTKRPEQQIGITLNFTSAMVESLYETIRRLSDELPIDYIQLQRVGPYGGAAKTFRMLNLEEILIIFRQVQRVDKQLNIAIEVVDSFPMCLLPTDLQKYTARCDWGYHTAYVDMYSNLSRCAVNQIPIGNVLDSEVPLKQLWEQHPSLINFREKKYLPLRCQQCELLSKCGGGCPSSCGGCELACDDLIARARF